MRNNKPQVLKGDMFKDNRGELRFVNDFNFKKVKRFYIVSNKKLGQFRGWHGHKKEAKYVFVVSGKARVGAVKINDWINPSTKQKVFSFSLSADNPTLLYIPPGFANGFRSLTRDTKIIFYSTASLSDSKKDDIRFDESYWNLNE